MTDTNIVTTTTEVTKKLSPELSLNFADFKGKEMISLWAPTSQDFRLACFEGQARAVSVFDVDVEGESGGDKAQAIGEIFGRILESQLFRAAEMSWTDVQAIRHFWAVVGELAAAYMSTQERRLVAGHAVCRRATRVLISHSEHVVWRKKFDRDLRKIRAAKRRRTKASKTVA